MIVCILVQLIHVHLHVHVHNSILLLSPFFTCTSIIMGGKLSHSNVILMYMYVHVHVEYLCMYMYIHVHVYPVFICTCLCTVYVHVHVYTCVNVCGSAHCCVAPPIVVVCSKWSKRH